MLASAAWNARVRAEELVAPRFRAVAFYPDETEPAHMSFIREANRWFPAMGAAHNFSYQATTNWSQLNDDFLARVQVVLFLDQRPEEPAQRAAFERYMERGGGWMGFHFAAFAMNDSGVKENWPWYHERFLGSGEYWSNTWRPTSAVLRVEDPNFPATRGLPATFLSAPNEWYRWRNNLRTNADIKTLVSIDPASFPLGTGPKPSEIWHGGDYPVVWTNTKYRMVYFNMGHNDIDYEHKTNRQLSFTFTNAVEEKLILNTLEWLGASRR